MFFIHSFLISEWSVSFRISYSSYPLSTTLFYLSENVLILCLHFWRLFLLSIVFLSYKIFLFSFLLSLLKSYQLSYWVGQKDHLFFSVWVSYGETWVNFLASPISWPLLFLIISQLLYFVIVPLSVMCHFFWMLWRLISLTDVLRCGFRNHVAVISSNIFSLLHSHSSSETPITCQPDFVQ